MFLYLKDLHWVAKKIKVKLEFLQISYNLITLNIWQIKVLIRGLKRNTNNMEF